jgi:hypothetical protein
MCSLDDPALRQSHEPRVDFFGRPNCLRSVVQGFRRAVSWMPYDFDTNMVQLLDVASTLSSVRAVGVKPFESRRFGTRLRDNCSGSISILHARGSHFKGNI